MSEQSYFPFPPPLLIPYLDTILRNFLYVLLVLIGLPATETIEKIKDKAKINEQLILESIGKANRGTLQYCAIPYYMGIAWHNTVKCSGYSVMLYRMI